jgi:hypothetical protein
MISKKKNSPGWPQIHKLLLMPFSGRNPIFWQKGHRFLGPNCFDVDHVYISAFSRRVLVIMLKATKSTKNLD